MLSSFSLLLLLLLVLLLLLWLLLLWLWLWLLLLLLNVIVSLLLFIIDEGTGDVGDRFVLLKPTLSEAVFRLLLWNEYVPDASFCCWDCFRTTLTHLRAFYKLDVEGDNRWTNEFSQTPLETNEWLSFMSELHEVWCPDVIGLGFGVWGNPIVMLFKKVPHSSGE